MKVPRALLTAGLSGNGTSMMAGGLAPSGSRSSGRSPPKTNVFLVFI
jgi:hypothetical protein